MSSKQLGALLNTRAAGDGPARRRRSPSRRRRGRRARRPAAAPLRGGKEVPLQVLIPEHIREQLGIMAAKERASLRALDPARRAQPRHRGHGRGNQGQARPPILMNS